MTGGGGCDVLPAREPESALGEAKENGIARAVAAEATTARKYRVSMVPRASSYSVAVSGGQTSQQGKAVCR